MRLVTDLFVVENQVQLVGGFNSFLPPGYIIDKDLNFHMPGDPVSNFYLEKLGRNNEANSAYHDTVKRLTKRYTSPYRKTKEEGPVTFNTSIAYVNKVKVKWYSDYDRIQTANCLVESIYECARNVPAILRNLAKVSERGDTHTGCVYFGGNTF